MTAKFVEDVVAELILVAHSAPSPFEFEMAYQSRIACDRIRFVIKNMESLATVQGTLRESCCQLLDALQRLERVDRRFQTRSTKCGKV
jgi:hypothetical protein